MNDNPGGAILSNEEAKAVQETAKATGKAIDAARDMGGYLREVMGQLPHDAVGIIGDAVKRARARLADNAAQKLRERDEEHPQLPSPSLLLPLVEKAEQETRPELEDLWAGLLASAMQPGQAGRMRREFFDTLAKIESQDALVLGLLFLEQHRGGDKYTFAQQRAQEAGIDAFEFNVAVERLMTLGLTTGQDQVTLTSYGRIFIRACRGEGGKS